MPKSIAIIGAGISGLSCAYELNKAGHEVSVFEKNQYVGGRMSSRVKEGLLFDIGADHLTNNYTSMRAYGEELGLEWQKVDFLQYRILRDGNLYAPQEVLFSWFSKVRLALQWMRTPTDLDYFNFSEAAKYDDESATDFFRRRCGQEAVDYLLDPYSTAYQFHRAEEASKAAVIASMNSLKKEAEGWYLHHFKGGMKMLPEALAAKLNVQTGSEVTALQKKDDTWILTVSGEEKSFDTVVLACTADVTAELLKDQVEEEAQNYLKSVRYASSISVSFRVDRDLLPDVSTIWVPYVEQGKIAAYVNESYKGADDLKDGKTLISVWLHEEWALELMKHSEEEVFEKVKEAFVEVCPWFENSDPLEAWDLERWKNAEPVYKCGHIKATKQFLEQFQGKEGLYFCGDYLNAPWTEGAIRSGQSAAQSLRAV